MPAGAGWGWGSGWGARGRAGGVWRGCAADGAARRNSRGGSRERRWKWIGAGGVGVGQDVHEGVGRESPLGTLDVAFGREDCRQNGRHRQVRGSAVPFEIGGEDLVLIGLG
ncbi:hypothetical protein B1218_33310, partial [Pseudomonas ogarae]